jgi:anti-sigma factor ChrR (cupin superfamily)
VALVSASEAERVSATPPSRVKDALMRKIGAPPSIASIILRASEGVWNMLMPGIEVKELFADPLAQTVTSLVRVAAGAIYPAHLHTGTEHLYVLDGDIVFDDHTLSSGDYEVRLPHTKHSSATTAPGETCLLLVISNGLEFDS